MKRLLLAFLLASSMLFAGTYKLDPTHSHVGFSVKHMMISNVKGEFDKFTGTFELDKAKGDKAYGKLTMHGVTKNIKLDLTINGMIKDSRGNIRTGLSLTSKINRKNYDLNWNKIIEAGGVLVGDTIKIDVEIEGILVK